MGEYERFQAECGEDVAAQGADDEFSERTRAWTERAMEHRYSYHFEWLGRPIIQFPQDIVAVQELVSRVQPDLIIETGIACRTRSCRCRWAWVAWACNPQPATISRANQRAAGIRNLAVG